MKAVVIADGQRKFVPGPLRALLASGGLLVVNWSEFSDTQKSSYMSMLEKSGTLMGVDVSPDVKIISLIKPEAAQGCQAFLSRTTLYYLSAEYTSRHVTVPVVLDRAYLEVDLYHQPNWRERLLGVVIEDGHAKKLLDNGKLLQAIRSGKSLRIYNPPDDPKFLEFIERIKHERRFMHNGEMIAVPEALNIQVQARVNPLQSQQIKVETSLPSDPQPGLFCNANNIHECYQRTITDNNTHQRHSADGWFATHHQFYLTDTITSGEWQELIAEAQNFPYKKFTFTLLAGAKIQGVADSQDKSIPFLADQLVVSNDPDFYEITQKQVDADLMVIYVSPLTTYQELVAVLKDKRHAETGGSEFTYKTLAFTEALQQGRSVLINGSLSPLLYQQLLPYLLPRMARLFHNGKEWPLTGKLQWVMPASNAEELALTDVTQRHYHCNDYRARLPDTDCVSIDKVERLFNLARQLSHMGIGQPDVPTLTFQRLTSMLTRLSDDGLRNIHRENPVKGLLHYDYLKTTTNYQFLNVIAKYLFASTELKSSIRVSKVRAIDQTQPDAIWKILNCCNGAAIRALFKDDLDQAFVITQGKPSLLPEAMHQFKLLYQTLLNTSDNISMKAQGHKSQQQLTALRASTHVIGLFLKGAPGSGKTYGLRQLEQTLPAGHYFKGRVQMKKWLQANTSDEQDVLAHFDEANMEATGTWDDLKGLARKPAATHYRGTIYRRSDAEADRLFGVFSGNPATYPKRSHHRFLQEYTETILYQLPHDDWMREHLITPLLRELKINMADDHFICDKLLWAFHHIKDYNPLIEISLRDMKSLLQRFSLLYQQHQAVAPALAETCRYEFAYGIADAVKRAQFMQAVGATPEAFNADEIIMCGDLYIPAGKYPIVNLIEQDLAMCERAVKAGQSYRYGILSEGVSAAGKSSLFKTILHKHGYRKDHADPAKRYYEITLDNSDSAPYLLLKAVFGGSKVLLDEINLCPEIETLLIDLLEGLLPDQPQYRAMIKEIAGDNPVIIPGFQVLTTKNPAFMAGRKASSLALMNRFHCYFADAYIAPELLAILKKAGIPDPQDVVTQFLQVCHDYPEYFNPRKLFEWIRLPEAKLLRIGM